MSDLIDRDAAIEAIKNIPEGNWSVKRYINEILRIPSVNPCENCYYMIMDEDDE